MRLRRRSLTGSLAVTRAASSISFSAIVGLRASARDQGEEVGIVLVNTQRQPTSIDWNVIHARQAAAVNSKSAGLAPTEPI